MVTKRLKALSEVVTELRSRLDNLEGRTSTEPTTAAPRVDGLIVTAEVKQPTSDGNITAEVKPKRGRGRPRKQE